MRKAKKLTRPTGKPVKVYGPTDQHSHAPRGITGSVLLEHLASSKHERANLYVVPGGRDY